MNKMFAGGHRMLHYRTLPAR